jgi:5-methylthioribose kinase
LHGNRNSVFFGHDCHGILALMLSYSTYRPQSPETLAAYLSGIAAVRELLGGDSKSWTTAEVGDGNLNLVFIVKGANAGVAVKQALPYVRLVGESWPLP